MAKKQKRNPQKYIARRRRLVFLFFLLVVVAAFWAGMKMPDLLDGTESFDDSISAASSIPDPFTFSSDDFVDESENSIEPETADWSLILVNSRLPLAENFSVDLEIVADQHQVDTRIAQPLKNMFADAKASGISLILHSAHHSVEYHAEFFDQVIQSYIASGKNADEAAILAEQYYATPGASEHHTGLAVDIVTASHRELTIGLESTPAFKWLSENAHTYGFILRYPEDKFDITQINYKPWHYRYVGVAAATEIHASGLCLEEYLYVKGLEQEAAERAAEEAEDESDESSVQDAPAQ